MNVGYSSTSLISGSIRTIISNRIFAVPRHQRTNNNGSHHLVVIGFCSSTTPRRGLSSSSSASPLYSRWVNNNNKKEDANNDTANIIHQQQEGPDEGPTTDNRTIVFLHGLLGNGKNINKMSQEISKIQKCRGLILDLTGHGQSTPLATTNTTNVTFAHAVNDIRTTIVENSMSFPSSNDGNDRDYSTFSMVGHSLGGRLALYYASYNIVPLPDRIWLLDTVPGIVDASVLKVLYAVRDISRGPLLSKKEVSQILTKEHSLHPVISQWLAAQYQVDADLDTRRFGFDIDIAESLVEDFSQHDFWAQLHSLMDKIPVHLVQGGRNPAWNNNDIQHDVERYANSNPNFYHHVLPNAGHWVHTDDLPGLLDIVRSVKW